mgnify:CR=1 FL=1
MAVYECPGGDGEMYVLPIGKYSCPIDGALLVEVK